MHCINHIVSHTYSFPAFPTFQLMHDPPAKADQGSRSIRKLYSQLSGPETGMGVGACADQEIVVGAAS
jgi:hypothetical protein